MIPFTFAAHLETVMFWHLVVIEKHEKSIAEMEGNNLLEKFRRESGAAYADPAVEVLCRRDAEAT